MLTPHFIFIFIGEDIWCSDIFDEGKYINIRHNELLLCLDDFSFSPGAMKRIFNIIS